MIGETVGNFEIVSQLGKGGMGEVWLAEQKSIRTKVAIKVLHADVSTNTGHVQRFFNEVVAVGQIHHAGIVRMFDCGHHANGRAYVVMEFLDGETLTDRIKRAGKLGLGEVAELGRQIASVLDATHGAGITHRDLKPDNIYLVRDAELASGVRVKVLDFGIAKLSNAKMTALSVSNIGTPSYMSPEQWHSLAQVDWRADAYSLGCVVFEMACGRPPFVAGSFSEAAALHLTEPPPAPSSVVPGLPPAFDELVLRLLEKEPGPRPTMRDTMAAFEAIGQGRPAGMSSVARARSPVPSGPPEMPAPIQPAASSPGMSSVVRAASPVPSGPPEMPAPGMSSAVRAPGMSSAVRAPSAAEATPYAPVVFPPTTYGSSQLPRQTTPADAAMSASMSASQHMPPAASASMPYAPARKRTLPLLLAIGALVIGGTVGAAVVLTRKPESSAKPPAAANDEPSGRAGAAPAEDRPAPAEPPRPPRASDDPAPPGTPAPPKPAPSIADVAPPPPPPEQPTTAAPPRTAPPRASGGAPPATAPGGPPPATAPGGPPPATAPGGPPPATAPDDPPPSRGNSGKPPKGRPAGKPPKTPPRGGRAQDGPLPPERVVDAEPPKPARGGGSPGGDPIGGAPVRLTEAQLKDRMLGASAQVSRCVSQLVDQISVTVRVYGDGSTQISADDRDPTLGKCVEGKLGALKFRPTGSDDHVKASVTFKVTYQPSRPPPPSSYP